MSLENVTHSCQVLMSRIPVLVYSLQYTQHGCRC